MRRLALAIALACILSGAARAGEIPSTGAVAQPTPSPVSATGQIHAAGATVPVEIHTTGATAPDESSTLLTIILTLISIAP
jgi:hypothetical protein